MLWRDRRRDQLSSGRRFLHCLHAEADAALLVGFKHLDLHHLAFLEVVGDQIDPLLADLRDVQQSVLARQHLHNRAEIEQLEHRAVVDTPDFYVGGDIFDTLLGQRAALGTHAGN